MYLCRWLGGRIEVELIEVVVLYWGFEFDGEGVVGG